MRPANPTLTPQELTIMKVVWTLETATVRDVYEHFRSRRTIAYTTVLTLTSRLWSRGLLAREPEGRGFRYRPAKSREELLAALSDELIDRLLGDFGEIAVARLGVRLDELDAERGRKLRQTRQRQ